ncbi:hypothetical protein YYC_03556 [Plasmodium yoelii 17X]|nr:methyltransferase, putative [Plasmodium yoelii]ETB58732.1 hypothetical protein YYC_03556 [Plasmodium yoelii 17X]CDU16833.1 conserved Plasmodium protein, unknown function [Plasmodium yoelii]VTZ74492.1 methyltransferase, putative [Plasmodium yoelii]|eukprot:XP_022811719.1 methyltransferase, putative [Plasmodium yoelii]
MYYVKKYEHKILGDTLRFLGFTINWGIHENGYWLTNLNYSFDYILSNLIIKYFKGKNIKTVLDIGCGHGYYVNELNFHKIWAAGIDGNHKLVSSLNNERIYSLDVTDKNFIHKIMNKINNSIKVENEKGNKLLEKTKVINKNIHIPQKILTFDYVLCLNVGEYIPKKKEKIFLENLDRINNKGIIISWDIPGTFNIGTINEKSGEELIEIFMNDYNYKYDEKNSKLIRENCNNKSFKRCLYIFEKKNMYIPSL